MFTKLTPITSPAPYCVICEQCKKTIFFSGQENQETFTVLCDECSQQ